MRREAARAECSHASRLHPHASKAFTLVEVLAALVLIAVVLPVTMRAVTVSIRAAAHARHITEAGQLAEMKLAELRLLTDTSNFAGSGAFDDKPDYRWESVSNYANYGCYEVVVRVTWREQGVERSLSLATLIHPSAAPEEPEPEAAS